MRYYAGVDIGGTNTKIGLVDDSFNVLAQTQIKTRSADGAERTFTRIWESINQLVREQGLEIDALEGIGLGIPGPVVDNAIVKIAANFSWGNDFNAKALLERIAKKPVKVDNDVRVITLGEKLFGQCQHYDNAIVIPIGTGVASGLIINGQVVAGSAGFAGEFGHIRVEENGYQCGCGLQGCLETYVSAPGIVRAAKKALKEKPSGMLYQNFSNCLERLEAHHVFECAQAGDELAEQVIAQFCRHLAFGIGVLVNLLNPQAIVLAGGVAKSGDYIIERVWRILPHFALGVSLKTLTISATALSETAGIKGAAALMIKV
ncbi:ROK family protein [Pasteurellaceae bacterium HPA106]|uniref:ROK family protein n=1 Tax=Spirabiliibacterium pneumoniae TaxID=221400 RepID=UPI001AAD961F|nr:ROK family protein [Spirabiliibacterium pneumoniae]MBE2897134.1 ROK family protein [Spirabiliibacterium pneumoniae]